MIKLGVIGKPSDWLIASDVEDSKAKEIFDVELCHIDIKELITLSIEKKEKVPMGLFKASFDEVELEKAYHIYLALKDMIQKYDLAGLTIRCFDLLGTVKSTSCLAFALLNQEGIIATCEGDVPSMLSMYLMKSLLNKPAFQANPSRIDVEKNQILFAHCTLPLSMCTSYHFDTHFESGTGVGVKGELEEREISVFRIDNSLSRFVLLKGRIVENYKFDNLCRTQILLQLEDDVTYFLRNPLGNHHLIVYGQDTDALKDYLLARHFQQVH